MMIPIGIKKLHKANPAFDQPTGKAAVSSKRRRPGILWHKHLAVPDLEVKLQKLPLPSPTIEVPSVLGVELLEFVPGPGKLGVQAEALVERSLRLVDVLRAVRHLHVSLVLGLDIGL